MRVRADPAALNRDITVPRPVSRQKSYRGLSSQASSSSGSTCASLTCLEDRIEEESEESEMVLGGPSSDRSEPRAETSQARSNGNNWFPERDEYDSDKEDDDELPQEPVVREIGPQLPGIFDEGYHDNIMPNSGIIVTVSPSGNVPTISSLGTQMYTGHSVTSRSRSDDDNSDRFQDDLPSSSSADNQLLIQLRVREYQGNFDGFAEINRFETIEEMHEFIVNNSETVSNEASAKQNRYLDILLKERAQDRFGRLVETSKGTVRRVLSRNEHILRNLFASASLENFPSPLGPKDDDDATEDEEEEEAVDRNENIAEVEENMKRWYMIEMIGIWLKLVTDVTSYREAIKKSVLKTSCGIENDRYEGIAVPLKYK